MKHMEKDVIIYSVGHTEYRWAKMYSRLSHILPFSTTGFYAKVSLLSNSHRKCHWTPTILNECPLCARLYDQCWERGQDKIDTDPHLMELTSFPRHVSHEEGPPASLSILNGAPTDPLSTLVHISCRLKDYRNGTLCTNSLCLGQRTGSAKKKQIGLARKWDQNQKEENPSHGVGSWQKATPLRLMERKGSQSLFPAANT